MSLRKILFWTHLSAGIVAGAIVLLMSITGVLLMYEKQMVAWAEGGHRSQITDPSLERVLRGSIESRNELPSMFALPATPGAAAALTYGRDTVFYVDASTGAPLAEGSQSLRAFFHSVTDWHRWLGMDGEGRAVGRAITGACNLAFLILIVTGAYLWLPRAFGWQHIRAIAWFRAGLSGKARDFNWHNVIGLWCLTPLLLVVISGVVISYPWASDLVYKAPAGSGRKKGSPGDRKQGPGGPPASLDLTGFDDAWRTASRHTNKWANITFRLPLSDRAPLIFQIDEGYAGQPQKRTTLTFSRDSPGTPHAETFAQLEPARQWRTWLRFVHTGEYYGLPGQTIAGAASLGASFLVYTGIALSWRRWRAWRVRQNK